MLHCMCASSQGASREDVSSAALIVWILRLRMPFVAYTVDAKSELRMSASINDVTIPAHSKEISTCYLSGRGITVGVMNVGERLVQLFFSNPQNPRQMFDAETENTFS